MNLNDERLQPWNTTDEASRLFRAEIVEAAIFAVIALALILATIWMYRDIMACGS